MGAKRSWAGGIGIILFFFIYSGLLYANLVFLELIGKESVLETDENDNNNVSSLNGYAWAGGFGWVIFIFGLAFIYYSLVEDEIDSKMWFGLQVFYALTWYLIIGISCNLDPFPQYREYKKGKDGLGAPQIHISCWANSSSGNITLPLENSYITLTDTEWQPSLDTSVIKTGVSHGWDYVLSPIEYRGPLKNCVIEPQIYAACFGKNTRGNEATACGWGRTGMVTIRRIAASPYLETIVKDKLPCASFPDLGSKYGWWNMDKIFEWNTITRYEMVAILSYVDAERDSVYKKITIGWFVATGVITILCVVFPEVMSAIAAGFIYCVVCLFD